MLYFSNLHRKHVVTEDGIKVGRLDDLVLLISSTQPKITKLLVDLNYGKKIFIPINHLIKINNEIIIEKNFVNVDILANEIFVLRNILDKQIIDLSGEKIVRVNDVVIQVKDNNNFYLAGVDIGFLGILRRLGLENFALKIFYFFGIKIKPHFLPWSDIQPLELTRGQVIINKKEEKLAKIRPEDLADYLEKTNIENAKKILDMLDEKKAIEVVSDLNLSYQSNLLRRLKLEEAVKFIKYIEPDEAVDILLTLREKRRQQIINLLPPEKKKEIVHLLNLSSSPIGELATTEFLTVKPETTVNDVIKLIKKETVDFAFLTTIYVVDESNKLVGVFNLHELLLQEPLTPVYKFMIQNLIVTHLNTAKEIVLKKMLKYNIQIIPIVDDNNHILGVVTIDDLSEFILKKIL
jgi:CBS domain-containing protein/sporulation protein YlmC with PRC-barrel domain